MIYFIPEFSSDEIIESMNDALIILDVSGTIRKANSSAKAMFKHKYDHIIKRSFREIINTMSKTAKLKSNADLLSLDDKDFHFHRDEIHETYKMSITPHYTDKVLTAYVIIFHDITARRMIEMEKESAIIELQHAITQIKTLEGILPVCASCKKIRDDDGEWEQMESYMAKHSKAQFSHSICPDCSSTLYPEYFSKKK